ncbi:MAG: histidine phosphatase family protein [bacterium]|nr:histidine phosphatase family protein [bacterium]
MAVRLILIRHGKTDWNVLERYQGHSDTELNETGRNQAQLLAWELENETIDVIYSSDLTRAGQTAAIVSNGRNIPSHKRAGLRECSFGIWEGKTFEEMQEKFPDEVARVKGDLVNEIRTGGESRQQLSIRVAKTIQEIIKNHPNQTVAIIAHGGSLAVALEYITGEGLIAPTSLKLRRVNRSKYWLDNAGYHIIEYNNGNSKILHLGTSQKDYRKVGSAGC